MKRWFFFLYGVVCHLLFLATFVYMAGFVGNLVVPRTIDSTGDSSIGLAIAINLLLLGLFGAHHSIMARPAFKAIWTRVVPKPIERSTYVLISCLVLGLLMWQWRGINTVVWEVQHPVARSLLWGLFATGWLLVPLASLLIDHFDLFGTRQVWLYLQGREYVSLPFRVPLLYKRVRHPLYVGWTIAFWATPTMTGGHLLFAVVLTGYMILAAFIEERDLITQFGSEYQLYRRQVPMFVPRWRSVPVLTSRHLYGTQGSGTVATAESCHV
jgi:protein-S-isoprenylcysteine O-methyltransferase Ste14